MASGTGFAFNVCLLSKVRIFFCMDHSFPGDVIKSVSPTMHESVIKVGVGGWVGA